MENVFIRGIGFFGDIFYTKIFAFFFCFFLTQIFYTKLFAFLHHFLISLASICLHQKFWFFDTNFLHQTFLHFLHQTFLHFLHQTFLYFLHHFFCFSWHKFFNTKHFAFPDTNFLTPNILLFLTPIFYTKLVLFFTPFFAFLNTNFLLTKSMIFWHQFVYTKIFDKNVPSKLFLHPKLIFDEKKCEFGQKANIFLLPLDNVRDCWYCELSEFRLGVRGRFVIDDWRPTKYGLIWNKIINYPISHLQEFNFVTWWHKERFFMFCKCWVKFKNSARSKK